MTENIKALKQGALFHEWHPALDSFEMKSCFYWPFRLKSQTMVWEYRMSITIIDWNEKNRKAAEKEGYKKAWTGLLKSIKKDASRVRVITKIPAEYKSILRKYNPNEVSKLPKKSSK